MNVRPCPFLAIILAFASAACDKPAASGSNTPSAAPEQAAPAPAAEPADPALEERAAEEKAERQRQQAAAEAGKNAVAKLEENYRAPDREQEAAARARAEASVAVKIEPEKRSASPEVRAYADEKLASLQLEPEIRISKQLKALGVSAECVGEKLNFYKRLQAAKNWEPWFVETCGYSDLSFLQDRRQVDSMAEAARSAGKRILVKTNMEIVNTREMPIWVLAIRPSNSKEDFPGYDYGFGIVRFTETIQSMADWMKHPDGAGYMFPYKHADDSFVFFRKPNEVPNPAAKASDQEQRDFTQDLVVNPAIAEYRTAKQTYESELKRLRQKKELGEITAEELKERVSKLRESSRQQLFSFADRY